MMWEPIKICHLKCEPNHTLFVDNTDGKGQLMSIAPYGSKSVTTFEVPDGYALCRQVPNVLSAEVREYIIRQIQWNVIRHGASPESEAALTWINNLKKNDELLRTKQKTAICPICKEPFPLPSTGRTKKFCSNKCKQRNYRRQKNDRN